MAGMFPRLPKQCRPEPQHAGREAFAKQREEARCVINKIWLACIFGFLAQSLFCPVQGEIVR
jgi:hypothetical protein